MGNGKLRAAGGLIVVLIAVLGLQASTASAAEHPLITGEYGKTGPAASGIGAGCRLAFDEDAQRLFLASDEKIYGLSRGGPGIVSPVAGGFPITGVDRTDCGDPDMEVDNSGTASAGRLYAIYSGPPKIEAWTPAGAEITTGWPFTFPSGEACGLAVTNNGEVWVSYYGGDSVVKISSAGVQTGTFSLGYKTCKLAVDPVNKDLYVVSYSDFGNPITKYTAASGYTTSKVIVNAGTGNPGLAVNGTLGKLYVGTGFGLTAYDTTTGASIETLPVEGPSAAQGLAIDESTDTVFANSGTVIREWAGIKVPKATTGDPVGNDEVTGTADPNEAGPITECYFEFGTESPAYGQKQNCAETLPITTEKPVSAVLPGLFGEQTYHYRLVLGTGAPGVIGKGGDKTIVPHYVPDLATGPATDITRTTATMNASFTGNGEDTEYFFEYGPDTSYGQKTALDTLTGPTGATPLTGAAIGLTAEHTYHYRVVAENGLGKSIGADETFVSAKAVKSLSTEPATDVEPHTATLNAVLDPDGYATSFYFEYGKSSNYGQVVPIPPGADAPTTAAGVIPVSFPVDELEQGKQYHYRVVAENVTGKTTATNDVSFETPSAPSIESFTSANVTAATAELKGIVNPNGEATNWRFEYGQTPAYGSSAPVPDGLLAAVKAGEPVKVNLTGLSGNTYHFRLVAESKWGTTTSQDQTFSFYPTDCPNAHFRQQTGSGYLPDCRAYELVSPGNAGSTILAPQGENQPLASNPSRFAFAGYFGVIEGTGDPQGVFGDLYISTRTNSGWVTRYAGRRGDEGAETQGPPNVRGGPDGPFTSLAMDKVLDWDTGQQGFVCCGLEGSYAPYLWSSNGDFLDRLPSNAADVIGGEADVTKGGFFGDAKPAPDFSHYFFSSNNVAFTPDGLTEGPGSAYDNDLETGEVTKISVTDEGDDIPRDAGPLDEYIKFPGVSDDGSHVVMSTEAAGGGQHLYLAIDASEFFDVSEGLDGLNHNSKFAGITTDGETIYFTSPDKLTAGDTDTSVDLYRWDEKPTPTVSLVSTGSGTTGNGDTCGATWVTKCGVGLVNTNPENEFGEKKLKPYDNVVAADAGDIYFYSPELLDNGRGTLGQRNLYVFRTGRPHYIATFTGTREVNRVQVSPDGLHMAFLTKEKLTSYENAGFSEVYTFEADTGAMLCVSCVPNGEPPAHNVEASENGIFMSDDGRTFFATQDGLVERDANGLWDVYEYVDSRPQLISSGTSDEDQGRFGHIGLMGVSADGVDVFFSTLDTLVPQDQNGPFYKFYNARINGGFQFVREAAPCVAADECHGPSSQGAARPPMGTSQDLRDGGNAKSAKPKKNKKAKKNKKKRKKKQKKGNRTARDGKRG